MIDAAERIDAHPRNLRSGDALTGPASTFHVRMRPARIEAAVGWRTGFTATRRDA